MTRALEGIRVLEVAVYMAGPACGQVLAALGAEVIKVEPPETGDLSRLVPPFAGPEGISPTRRTPDDITVSFLKRSRGKKSITLNLKTERGRALFLALAKNADVVFENLQPGSMQRLGLDYEAVRAVNPAIIYCSISGFGQTGPYRDWMAFDYIIQAMGGLMSVTGEPDGPPMRANTPIADALAPLHSVISILAALRFRDLTGVGQYIDVSMLDCLQSVIWEEPHDYYLSRGWSLRTGNRSNGGHPIGCYPTQDGWIVCAVGTDDQWRRMLLMLGTANLGDDPRFATVSARVQHAAEIDVMVTAWSRERTTEAAVAAMRAHGIPTGPVATIPDLMVDPHLGSRGILLPLRHPLLERPVGAVVANYPALCSEMSTDLSVAAPALGMHNGEIYRGLLGLSADELAHMRQDGII